MKKRYYVPVFNVTDYYNVFLVSYGGENGDDWVYDDFDKKEM